MDVAPLAKAVGQLTSAIQEQALEPQRQLLRAGLIQTFEYTYELAWKMIKRYLQETEPNPETVAGLSFEGMIRRADELGLLASHVAEWKDFRQARTDTSHAYNEDKAISVVARIPAFAHEVQYLLSRLQERTQSHA